MSVQWQAVERATGYRVERRTGDVDRWFDVAIADAATVAWTDDLVGEAQSLLYRVTPLLHRWTGLPSAASTVTTPEPAGPAGC